MRKEKPRWKSILLAISIFFIILIFFMQAIVYTTIDSPRGDKYAPITGRPVSTGVVSLTIVSICNTPLTEGWEFISLCSNVTNRSVSNIFRSIDGKYRFIMEWNSSAQNFIIYSPRAAVNPFDDIDLNKSYFLYFTDSSGTFSIGGPDFNDLNLSLIEGWNTPSYPYRFAGNISRYLPSNSKLRFMMKWNSSAQEFMIYSPLQSVRPFNTISQAEGQFLLIKDPAGAVIYYNKSDLH